MLASMPLEELHGPLVPLRGRERLEGAQVPPLARARVLLARVEAELARLELPDHAANLLICSVACHEANHDRRASRRRESTSPSGVRHLRATQSAHVPPRDSVTGRSAAVREAPGGFVLVRLRPGKLRPGVSGGPATMVR